MVLQRQGQGRQASRGAEASHRQVSRCNACAPGGARGHSIAAAPWLGRRGPPPAAPYTRAAATVMPGASQRTHRRVRCRVLWPRGPPKAPDGYTTTSGCLFDLGLLWPTAQPAMHARPPRHMRGMPLIFTMPASSQQRHAACGRPHSSSRPSHRGLQVYTTRGTHQVHTQVTQKTLFWLAAQKRRSHARLPKGNTHFLAAHAARYTRHHARRQSFPSPANDYSASKASGSNCRLLLRPAHSCAPQPLTQQTCFMQWPGTPAWPLPGQAATATQPSTHTTCPVTRRPAQTAGRSQHLSPQPRLACPSCARQRPSLLRPLWHTNSSRRRCQRSTPKEAPNPPARPGTRRCVPRSPA